MEYQYPHNDHKTMITYMRSRTGPNWFRVYYNNSCVFKFTPKDVGRVFGIAKFTPSINNIRDWCKEMVSKYDQPVDMGANADNSVSSVSDGEHEGMSNPSPMVI